MTTTAPPTELDDTPDTARPRPRWADRVIPLLLVAVTLLVLGRVCVYDFTVWDDDLNVSANARLNPATLHNLLYFWRHPFEHTYIPLTYTVWGGLAMIGHLDAVDERGIGLNPWVFHAANLLVHTLGVLAAYQLLKLLTRRPWAAAAGAMLFAIHPLQVEPVAWVTGMKDVLCGMLSIVALWQYMLFASEEPRDTLPPATPAMRRVHYAVATLALILAMLSKPSAMTVPIAAMLLDRFVWGRPWKRIIISLLPWLALAVACALVARIAQPGRTQAALVGNPAIALRPLIAADALTFYLYKIIFPARLGAHYAFAPRIILAGKWVWFAWIVVVALGVMIWLQRNRRPWLIAAAGLLVVSVAPVLGFVWFDFERHSLVADRYVYVGMLGPALALAFFLASLRRWQLPATLGACALLAAAGVMAFVQAGYWRDSNTLFAHALEVNPNSDVAYTELAACAVTAKQPAMGERLALQAVRLNPEQGEAYITLGTALLDQGRPAEALAAYRIAYTRTPDDVVLLSNLAGLTSDAAHGDPKQIELAIRIGERAVELDDLSAQAHANLGVILSRAGRFPEALRHAQASVRLDPNNARSQTSLAFLLDVNGDHAGALAHVRRAMELDPDYDTARRLYAHLTGR